MKRLIRKIAILGLALASSLFALQAQTNVDDSPWIVTVQTGLLFGAAAPIPVPKAVQKVYTWYPKLNPTLNVVVTRRLSGRLAPFGVFAGFSCEFKGMEATTQVKDLAISLQEGQDVLKGTFTGDNLTSIHNGYLVLPFGASYHFGGKVPMSVEAGLYASLLLQGSFKTIIDGRMTLAEREGAEMELELQEFDFSDRFNPIDFGAHLTFNVYPWPRFGFSAGLKYGLTSIVKKDFDAIPFKLHNVFGMVGFSYRLTV